VELRNAISARFGIELPATITFDYPSIEALAGFLAERLAHAGQAQQVQQAQQAQDTISSAAPVARSQLLERWQQQGSETEIIGWAASMASGGEPGASESVCRTPCLLLACFGGIASICTYPLSIA